MTLIRWIAPMFIGGLALLYVVGVGIAGSWLGRRISGELHWTERNVRVTEGEQFFVMAHWLLSLTMSLLAPRLVSSLSGLPGLSIVGACFVTSSLAVTRLTQGFRRRHATHGASRPFAYRLPFDILWIVSLVVVNTAPHVRPDLAIGLVFAAAGCYSIGAAPSVTVARWTGWLTPAPGEWAPLAVAAGLEPTVVRRLTTPLESHRLLDPPAIVITDDLVESMDEQDLVAFLHTEIGRRRHARIANTLLVALALAKMLTLGLALLLVHRSSPALVLGVLGAAAAWLTIFGLVCDESRRAISDGDTHALDAASDPATVGIMLEKLAQHSGAQLTSPTPVEPPMIERIAATGHELSYDVPRAPSATPARAPLLLVMTAVAVAYWSFPTLVSAFPPRTQAAMGMGLTHPGLKWSEMEPEVRQARDQLFDEQDCTTVMLVSTTPRIDDSLQAMVFPTRTEITCNG